MKIIICPNCKRPHSMIEIADGIYRCSACGYTGDQSGKGAFKEIRWIT